MNRALADVIDRAQSWPEDAQLELEHAALEIEAELRNRTDRATAEELAGIERGLRAAERGHFATDKDIEAVFAKYRRS